MDNEFKYLCWTELHKLLTVLGQWVAAKQQPAAQAYLPEVKNVWYEQAVTSGILHDIAKVARELGEEPTVISKLGSQYKWQIDEVIEPRETRLRLIRALEVLRTKVQTNVPKKHGLFPV